MRMFELSPLVTAATASVRAIPASARTSRSKPIPTIRSTFGCSARRRNEASRRSMIATVPPSSARCFARADPTRPHPTITTCITEIVENSSVCCREDVVKVFASPLRWGDHPRAMASAVKRILIGRALATHEEHHQRLSKKIALPVFASDAISSTAYATEEILRVFLVGAGAGLGAYSRLGPISIVVVFLLVIVVVSYRQTIFAYPSGGGSYVVSRENLGEIPSMVAGASLLTDYVLTVAVSVAGGVAAIISAFPGLDSKRVPLCVGFILLMTLANLRGLKESGALFAPPTYIYVASLIVLIIVGLYRVFVQDLAPIPHDTGVARELLAGQGAIGLFIFLKAFASGAVALTGVEAVSNGVPAFKKNESRNAAVTLMWMAIILGGCFFGLSVLAQHLKPIAGEGVTQTVLAQLAEHVYGGRNLLFFVTQFATFAILILAANTAYADYPRLSSIIARDGYLPRQFANRGDRLVYSNGIIFLAAAAVALVVVFHGKIDALIPLYAVGVFTGFTLSQTGMCVHHVREKEPRWRLSIVINALGAFT